MFRWLQRWRAAPRLPAPSAAVAPSNSRELAAPAAAAPTGLSFAQKDDVNTRYYDWLFGAFGGGRHGATADVGLEENAVLEAQQAILDSPQSGADMVRRMPGLIPQLLQSLRSDGFSAAQIARTISLDVVLVEAVVRLANQSMLSQNRPIASVEHAVFVIGQEGLRHLITAVAFRPIIDLQSGPYTRALAPRIWEQSERHAVASRLLAERQRADPFPAFLAGLVQDAGLILSLRLMDQAGPDVAMGSPMFRAALLRNAHLISCSIGQQWDFPPAVTLGIREQLGAHRRGVLSPLGQLLSTSDYLGKIGTLAGAGLLDTAQEGLFDGLPEEALQCYRDLYGDLELPLAAGAGR